MKEKPILFSAPMVRAILAGRKTQTRRIVYPQIDDATRVSKTDFGWEFEAPSHTSHIGKKFVAGDRLWVREAVRAEEIHSGLDGVHYLADGDFRPIQDTEQAALLWVLLNSYRNGRGLPVPPIHMPRWASRITLEITDVRVQRLQEISEEDAKAEGVSLNSTTHWETEARDAYCALWKTINGPDSWSQNPWVWVISFRVLDPSNPT